jgi:hypothetical protein
MADSTETKRTQETTSEAPKDETKPATYTEAAANAASTAATAASSAATTATNNLFSMFGGGAKKERKADDEDDAKDEPSGSSKAQKKDDDDDVRTGLFLTCGKLADNASNRTRPMKRKQMLSSSQSSD